MRNICDEENDLFNKMHAYDSIGRAYQATRSYDNALKCFKKMLELAWRVNDASGELMAYELIGL